MEVGPVPAVLTLGEALRVPLLERAKVVIDFDAFVEVGLELLALWHFVGTSHSVVINALDVCSLVWQAGQLIVGLSKLNLTRYSWNANGTSFTLFRWFSGRSRRCMCDRE